MLRKDVFGHEEAVARLYVSHTRPSPDATFDFSGFMCNSNYSDLKTVFQQCCYANMREVFSILFGIAHTPPKRKTVMQIGVVAQSLIQYVCALADILHTIEVMRSMSLRLARFGVYLETNARNPTVPPAMYAGVFAEVAQLPQTQHAFSNLTEFITAVYNIAAELGIVQTTSTQVAELCVRIASAPEINKWPIVHDVIDRVYNKLMFINMPISLRDEDANTESLRMRDVADSVFQTSLSQPRPPIQAAELRHELLHLFIVLSWIDKQDPLLLQNMYTHTQCKPVNAAKIRGCSLREMLTAHAAADPHLRAKILVISVEMA